MLPALPAASVGRYAEILVLKHLKTALASTIIALEGILQRGAVNKLYHALSVVGNLGTGRLNFCGWAYSLKPVEAGLRSCRGPPQRLSLLTSSESCGKRGSGAGRQTLQRLRP